MCGICGLLDPGGVTRDEVEAMAAVLSHRGPDDQGIWIGQEAGLGHRRLSIIDVEHGRQPIFNEDGSIAVVFNGEIYNYRELRDHLMARGHRFQTQTDTEVIVHAYEEYGEDCVRDFRGMFAFGLWDSNRHRFFAARDRLGQKPFFYAQIGRRLAFASEIKALLQIHPELRQVNRHALDQYLTLRIITPPRTMYQGIKKLPPAHRLVCDERGLRIDRYWDVAYEPKRAGREEEFLDELEDRLVRCLRLHMISDVPIGAFLSGGMDSSLVVALLRAKVTDEPLRTFALGLPFREFDELPYARMVADRYGTTHHEKTVHPSLIRALPRLVWHLDEPSDPLSLCTYLIAQFARPHVKVMLGGDGGDELFGGYDRYYGHRYAGYYSRVPHIVRKQIIGRFIDGLPDGRWYKSASHQLKWLQHLSFFDGGRRYAKSLGYFYFDRMWRTALYGAVMQEVVDTNDPEAPIEDAFVRARARADVDRMLYADSQLRLPDHSAMILDRMTMAHGLEARSPFMDHELVEFVARLPVALKVRGRALRYLQTRLAARYLPSGVLTRPKQGFSSALPYMLKDEYQRLYELFLREAHLVRDGFFTQSALQRLALEHVEGGADHGNRLWLLVNSEVWYRMHIEQSPLDDLEALVGATDQRNDEDEVVMAAPAAPRKAWSAL